MNRLVVLAAGLASFVSVLFVPSVPALAFSGTRTGTASVSELEKRFVELVDRIDLASQQVDVIKDSALGGVIERGKTVIVHKNDMGSGLELERAAYTLDGAPLFDTKDAPNTLSAEDFELFNGPMEPGPHIITVSLVYRGTGGGLFSYLEGYRFKVESRYRLVVQEGRLNRLEIIAHTKDDMTQELKDRLAVRYALTAGPMSSAARSPAKPSTMTTPEAASP
ncbi:MAG: hypothetical protein H6729_15210 [Deltaproteobacteria bacterium]|nr:hypothetical protein [Deltaproteobacteria bacterium]